MCRRRDLLACVGGCRASGDLSGAGGSRSGIPVWWLPVRRHCYRRGEQQRDESFPSHSDSFCSNGFSAMLRSAIAARRFRCGGWICAASPTSCCAPGICERRRSGRRWGRRAWCRLSSAGRPCAWTPTESERWLRDLAWLGQIAQSVWLQTTFGVRVADPGQARECRLRSGEVCRAVIGSVGRRVRGAARSGASRQPG